MSVKSQQETLNFQAEVKQLLHLVTHSLYSHREIFLRELISNASDAADKLRYEALSDAALFEGDSSLKIQIKFDQAKKTLTIIDNGIGMSREEVINNLGTIAKSGTREYIESLNKTDKKNTNLIGQFGVGFYSAFVVAKQVDVYTRRAGAQADLGVFWSSKGGGEFEIKNIERTARGTEIVLHLKDDAEEFLDEYRLRSIINKYSDHIVLPILMDVKKDDKVEPEQINKATALWTLPRNKIKKEEYNELYKHISHDFEDALAWTHNKVEGKLEYTLLLYIPQRPPFDLFNREQKHGLKLYAQRVFVMDDAEQLLPMYLRFVRGVVDSNDLPLNVSREILQNNSVIETIKTACVKRILETLENLASNDKEKYAKFWKSFGQVLKEGVVEDPTNKEKIAGLLRFASTLDETETQKTSLQDYIERMQKNQENIYYITAESYLAAKSSPHLEAFRKKGIEVLILTDHIDEWLTSYLQEFNGKKLQSIAKSNVDISNIGEQTEKKDEKIKEQQSKDFESMIAQMKKVLGETAKDVKLTDRLTDSPACLIADENDMSLHLKQLMQQAGQAVPTTAPILEINPEHPLIEKLKTETDDERFAKLTQVLFDQALLAEGGKLQNPAEFVKRMNELLIKL